MSNNALYYIDCKNVKTIYPGETSKKVDDLGILKQYEDKKFTLREINQITAELIVKTPYVPGAMSVEFAIKRSTGHFHHILTFKNYDYEKQTKEDSKVVKFLY